MQVGKPYKATILKNYHILSYVRKSYAILTFRVANNFWKIVYNISLRNNAIYIDRCIKYFYLLFLWN